MPPVAFFLRMLQRIAVTLRSRSQQKFCVVLLSDFQTVNRPRRPHSQGLYSMLKVIDRAGRRCEVKQIVDLPGIEGLADILLQKFKSRFATEVCEVFHLSLI